MDSLSLSRKSSNLRVVWGPFLGQKKQEEKAVTRIWRDVLILRRSGSCGLGQRNADPASLQPSRKETTRMRASACLLSPLSPSSEHWPNPTEERGQAVQVVSSTQASLQGTGQGGGGWRGDWKQKWGRSAQQDHTILLTHPWVLSI